MSSIGDRMRSKNLNSKSVDSKSIDIENASDFDVVQQLRERVGKTITHSTPARRTYANSEVDAYRSVLTRLADITSRVESEISAIDEHALSSIVQNHIDPRIQTESDAVADPDETQKIKSALNETRELAVTLQSHAESLEDETYILASRLGSENDARLCAEIEINRLTSEFAKLQNDANQLADRWEQSQSLSRNEFESIRKENAALKRAFDAKTEELSSIRNDFERRASEASRRDAQHAELQRALERRLNGLTSQLDTERAANEVVGREVQQLADEYSRQMSNLTDERNRLRKQLDELKELFDQSQQRCREFEERITAIKKSERELHRQNDARGIQVERLKVMLNETIASEQDVTNKRSAELARMAESKTRWKLLLTQARQRHREQQTQSQELGAKLNAEQSRRKQAESHAARSKVTIDMLTNRIKTLKTLMQREVAAVRKREAALKRFVQNRSGQIDPKEILSTVETDERVRRLTHELTLTRRLVLSLQQKSQGLGADEKAASQVDGGDSPSQAAA